MESSTFESSASCQMLVMSDGSSIRVLRNKPSYQNKRVRSMMFIGGWGTVVEGWEFVTNELRKHFDLIYVETREKKSSILRKQTIHDLERLSSDLEEIISLLLVDQRTLVIFGSSFGGLIVAHGLSTRKYSCYLAVLSAPIAHLRPFRYAQYVVPLISSTLFYIIKPVVRQWLVRARAASQEQANVYTRILDAAEPEKWKAIGQHIISENYWDLYSNINDNVLLISVSSGDKFHPSADASRIASVMCNCTHVCVRTPDEIDSIALVDIILDHLNCPAGRNLL